MRRACALWLSVLVAVSGCASYTPSSMTVPKAGAMPAWRTEGPLSAGADAYVQKDRQKAVFDGELTAEGVLPIQVFVRNEGSRQLLVRPSTMTLALPDGSQLGPVGASAVAAKMESSGGVIGWTIGFGLIGFLAASSAEDKARAGRRADYRSKELQDLTLAKDDSAHGFVYFIPPPGISPFSEAVLMLRFVDAEDLTSTVIRLPLSGLEFKPPAKPEEAKRDRCR
jgi:hypothetical protein